MADDDPGPLSHAGVIAPLHNGGVFGRYRVMASIGRGGMGEVYLAQDTEHSSGNRLVALKVLSSPDDQESHDLVAMFMDEASIMARIDHPNVLRVFDFGRAGDAYFLAMEYLSGRPLVRIMIDAYARHQGMDQRLIAAIGADAAKGLCAAHALTGATGQPLNVVHRDVSPQNIFVTYRGIAKVIDFGVARASERLAKTNVGQLKGKAAYMSPEQIEGTAIDGRSDIFALGICLWEMSAGRRLFKRGTDYETMNAVLDAEIRPPSAFRPEVEPELDRMIMRALERKRSRRYQDAGEFADGLTRFAVERKMWCDGQGVAALVESLYGETAAREQSLIAKLNSPPSPGSDIDAIAALSGVSLAQHDGFREITLAGPSATLEELDDFGEMPTVNQEHPALVRGTRSDDGDVGRMESTIQRAVSELRRQLDYDETGRPVRRWPFISILLVLACAVGAGFFFLERSRLAQTVAVVPARPPSPVARSKIPRLSEVADTLTDRGLDLIRLGSSIAIDDGTGRPPVTVSAQAEVEAVQLDGSGGWLVRSQEPGLVSVLAIFRQGDRLRTKGLSVNDCPATVDLGDGTMRLRYGAAGQPAPILGTAMHTIEVPIPPAADRVELHPLAVAFGAQDPASEAVDCPSGWRSTTLRLERIPPGEYRLLWRTPDAILEQPMLVEDATRRPD